MTPATMRFGRLAISSADVAGKAVLEVGARDINGSFRSIVEPFGPATYIGVDIVAGPGVDEICAAADLVQRFGEEAFDVVISTEMLEHVEDWRTVTEQMKRTLRVGGALILTTRAPGFARHDWPGDFWRYTDDDLRAIFADMAIEQVEEDRSDMGAYVKARRTGAVASPDITPHPV